MLRKLLLALSRLDLAPWLPRLPGGWDAVLSILSALVSATSGVHYQSPILGEALMTAGSDVGWETE